MTMRKVKKSQQDTHHNVYVECYCLKGEYEWEVPKKKKSYFHMFDCPYCGSTLSVMVPAFEEE